MTKLCAVLSIAFLTIPARAVVWPGGGACAGTLQACIDSAAPGDAVQVGTNLTVNEDLNITKSLTLEPVVGVAPTVVGEITLQSGATVTDITLRGFTINGRVRAIAQAGDLAVRVLDNRISSSLEDRGAVEVASSPLLAPAGNLSVEVRRNDLFANGTGSSDFCGGVLVLPQTSPETNAWITDNSIFAGACDQGAGIVVSNGLGVAITVDVLRNDLLVPGTAFGLVLQNSQVGSGSALLARAIDNLITSQFEAVGASVTDSADGVLTLQMINNTIVDNLVGVMLIANPGQPMAGVFANNIVAGNPEEGLRIDAEGITNRHNLIFGNGPSTFTPGFGTVTADPQFVGGGDYHLQPSSPAIDAGDGDALQSDITTDLDGAPRIQLAAIDIGAYEAPEGAPAAVIPTLSWGGTALLAGLLLFGGGLILRRGTPRN
jgi:hypothetical protein